MGLLLLTLIISGLALHGWLFIEIQLNGIAFNLVVFSGAVLDGIVFMKFDRIINPVKNTFLTNPNIFIYTISFFFIEHLWMSLTSSRLLAS